MAVILVTGATSGIGRDAALRLARAGHRVLAGGRRPDALAELATQGEVEPLALDVADAASVEAARAEVERRTAGAGLDVLVNNAGYALPGPLEALSDADLRALFDTNVFGLLAVTRAFLPRMRERGAGRVVNVGSVMGRLTSSLPWKDRDSSTGRGRSVGSRFIGWPWCAEASPRSHPVPPGGSCGAGLGYHPDSPTVASAPDSRGPVLGGCTAFLPGLKAGASCGGVR
jgi:NAD(P)-dependent dehydrogenase (short-subunit alcohol dehydrogenase family)